ncbi:MAG TPA: hypothetical protein VNM92_12110 [Thermoanaerobaculia bacterium]|nr:hypothetical protein [Thermoanaerobaculia bacterium]
MNMLQRVGNDVPGQVEPVKPRQVYPTGEPLYDVDDLDARADANLRRGNGIIDEIVYPRLAARGVSKADYHRVVMGMVRSIQWSREFGGPTAKLLGVVPSGLNGTAAEPKVCKC